MKALWNRLSTFGRASCLSSAVISIAAALVLTGGVTFAADAQQYPSKVIRAVVGYPPGGSLDLVARLVANKLGPALGQQIIIDNRGGAAGNIAAEYVAKAPPDGYTLLMVAAPHAVNPSLFRSIGYDPVKDFTAITQINSNDFVLVVHPSVPVRTLKEFIAYAKEKKGGLTYASGGIGTAGHLGMELLKLPAGFEAIHVAYKGGGPALIDVRAGLVNAYILSPVTALPFLRSGEFRAIAATGLKRSPHLPDLPTIEEQGFPGFEVRGWQGIVAPAGTPPAIVNRLYEETAKILRMPDIVQRFRSDGVDPVGSTPAEFGAYIESEVARYAKVLRQSGAQRE